MCITRIYRPSEKDENEFNKFYKLNDMMTEEEKLEFYQSEYKGAAFVEFVGFRCTKRLLNWLDHKSWEEGRDRSTIMRRLITRAAEEEGFNRNA